MEFNLITKVNPTNTNRCFNQFAQTRWRVNMKGFAASFMTPIGDQANKAKYMIAMQMADKYLFTGFYLNAKMKNLHLRALAAIN